MTYKIKYRRKGRLFWKTLKGVIGHMYDHQSVESRDANDQRVIRQPQDRMVVYFQDGSVRTIHTWSECELQLGTDWVLFNKQQIEQKTGQPVTLNVQPALR